jgi:hypothetical protein
VASTFAEAVDLLLGPDGTDGPDGAERVRP